jgi:hypothetical protein
MNKSMGEVSGDWLTVQEVIARLLCGVFLLAVQERDLNF